MKDTIATLALIALTIAIIVLVFFGGGIKSKITNLSNSTNTQITELQTELDNL